MQKIKDFSRQFAGHFQKLNAYSFHVLAVMCELSCLFLLLSLALNAFPGFFGDPLFAADAAESCAQTGAGMLTGGIVLALLSDIIVKYDLRGEDQ